MLTRKQIDILMPNARTVDKFSTLGLCMFLAQCDHESLGFTRVKESFKYSAKRLLEVYPRYFNLTNVEHYLSNPDKIANKVYANRMGNSDEESGDGYKYRGRGYLQITGKEDYTECGQALELDLIGNPELLCLPSNALKSAVWYFKSNHLINIIDIEVATKKINGGLNGLTERTKLFVKYKKLFGIK
jgi:putative chitinase